MPTLFLYGALTPADEVQNGLQITALERESLVELRWINSNSSSVLVSRGGMLGAQPLYALRFNISGPKLRPQSGVRGAAAIEGRIDPWVVILPGNAEYVLRFPVQDLILTHGGTLAEHRNDDWTLKVSFILKEAIDHAPGGREVKYSITRNGETAIPFWKGTRESTLVHHAAK